MMPGTQSLPGDGEFSGGHLARADAFQAEIYRRMSPSRKLELAVSMNRQARELMESGLRQAHPELSAEQRRAEIARRILHART